MALTLTVVPWLLLLAGGPLLAALGARLWPQAARLLGAGGLGLLGLLSVRVVLGYDTRLAGYQFGWQPLGGLAWGVDGWSVAALHTLPFCALLAVLLAARSEVSRLLVATGLGVLACCAVTLPALLLSLGGGLLALGGLGLWEILALGLAGAGASAATAAPLVAVPLLMAGLGLLAVRQPDTGRPDAMLLRAAVVVPAAVLGLARLVTVALPESALIWTQATASVGAAACLWMGLRTLAARRLTGVGAGLAAMLAAAAVTGLGAARVDAWNGLVLLALLAGPAAGLVLLAAAGLDEPRWRRLRGMPQRARLVLLGGLVAVGAPLTPGLPGWLLLSMGAWQSPWWQSAWWSATLILGAWLAGIGAFRAALALHRGTPQEPPLPRLAAGLLVVGVLAVGLLPDPLLLGWIDHSTAEHLPRMVDAIGKLMEGTLGNLLPGWLKRWWL